MICSYKYDGPGIYLTQVKSVSATWVIKDNEADIKDAITPGISYFHMHSRLGLQRTPPVGISAPVQAIVQKIDQPNKLIFSPTSIIQ
jgi:hypothetical protein